MCVLTVAWLCEQLSFHLEVFICLFLSIYIKGHFGVFVLLLLLTVVVVHAVVAIVITEWYVHQERQVVRIGTCLKS